MKQYLKPLLVAFSIIIALFLTIYRTGSEEGGLGVAPLPQSRAAAEQQNKRYDLTALQVFNVALVRIKDNYVDPKRIDPKQMLIEALHGVEKTVAEVLVKESADKNKLNIKVDSFERTFDISGVDSPWALSSRIKGILRFIQSHLRKGTDIRNVEYAAVNGMLSTLDPHSMLMTPEIYDEMKLSTRGEFGGLGIVISMVKGDLTVMNPMKDTPASLAGINACDRILKIGEESTVNMTLTQAVSRLRGAPGSKIDITLNREGWVRPVRKTLTRAIIKVPSVISHMLTRKIGYVSLKNFQGNSFEDLTRHLEKLKEKGMRGLVLDLRDNPGGLLDQAIKISDAFIESGTLLATVSHAGKNREEKRATSEGTEPRYPIAVLVSSGSASASEIVAGALKNLDRAVIIGTRTFGKGSVQVLYDNDDGSALKLTIAQYLTPGDISIQSVGITPDIVSAPVVIQKNLLSLIRADHFKRENDLDKHLTHRNASQGSKPQKTIYYLAKDSSDAKKQKEGKEKPLDMEENLCLFPDRECTPEEENKFVEDFQIRFARDLLAQSRGWRRTQILATANSFFTKTEQDEERNISAALKDLGVDWSRTAAPKSAGEPKLNVSVITEPINGQASSCKRMKIKVTVKNDGTAPTSQLKAVTSSTNPIFDGHEFVFGRIDPKKSRTWVVPIKVRDAPARVDDVVLTFKEANDKIHQPYTFPVAIKGVLRSTFAYGYQLIDDLEGNKNGRVQRGEKVRLFVKVRNTGHGTSFRTITTLKNLSGVGIFIRKGLFILGELAPGESKTASFTFDVQNSFALSSFKLELTVFDDALNEFVTDKLTFPISDDQETPATATGVVRINAQRATFRAWPAEDAPIVGFAPRGSGFSVLGKTANWYRVLAAPDRPAFIAAKDITPGGQATPKKFTSRLQVSPPKLVVQVPSNITTKETIHLEGIATDENRVADLYIFVQNPDAKVEGKKVFYRSNGNAKKPKELRFSTEVPLWPGANYVSVHARENEEVIAKEMVVIFRKKK